MTPAIYDTKPDILNCDPHFNHTCRIGTFKMRMPTAKELTLEVMKLEMQKYHTKWWQIGKRLSIDVEIDGTINTARSLGYFKVK